MLKFDVSISQTAGHARRLELCWDDGSFTVIFLDQGFGWFRMQAGPSFDFSASPADQAVVLWNLVQEVKGQEASYLAAQMLPPS
jgi:hypothetical protein